MVEALEKIVTLLAQAFHYTLRNPRRIGGLALFVLVWLFVAFTAHVAFNFARGPDATSADAVAEVWIFLFLTFLVLLSLWAFRRSILNGLAGACRRIGQALAWAWQRFRQLGVLALAAGLTGLLAPEPVRADDFQLDPGLNVDASAVDVGSVLILPPAHVLWQDNYRYVCLSLMLLADEDDGAETALQVIALSDPDEAGPEDPEAYCTDLRRFYDRRGTQRLASSVVDGKLAGPTILTFDRRQAETRYFLFDLSKVPMETKPIWDALRRWNDLAVSGDWPATGAIVDPCSRPRSVRRAVTDTARTWILSMARLWSRGEDDAPDSLTLCG